MLYIYKLPFFIVLFIDFSLSEQDFVRIYMMDKFKQLVLHISGDLKNESYIRYNSLFSVEIKFA